MRSVIVSAPGKVILHGEHAVVYGKTAIAASLDLRTFLTLEHSAEALVRLSLPDVGVVRTWAVAELRPLIDCTAGGDVHTPRRPTPEQTAALRAIAGCGEGELDTASVAVVSFLYLYAALAQPGRSDDELACRVSVKSHLPIGAGLGSSAAYSVCVAGALLYALGHVHAGTEGSSSVSGRRPFSKGDRGVVNAWAFEAERIIHGNPSGVDNSVSVHGGALAFSGGQIRILDRMPRLNIVLTNTRVGRSTKALVAKVRANRDLLPRVVDHILDTVQAISDECLARLDKLVVTQDKAEIDGHYAALEYLIDINHALMGTVGVGHASLDRICETTRRHGLHSKLTGAGGGGCALTLVPEGFDESKLASAVAELESQGFECWRTAVGGVGVAVEERQ